MKRNSSSEVKRQPWTGLPLQCERCGDPIKQPVEGRPRAFCSTACRVAAHRERKRVQAALARAQAGAGAVTWECDDCGAVLRYDRSSRRRKVPTSCPVCGSSAWRLGKQDAFF